MRLIDIITPEILEKAMHPALPSDPVEAKRVGDSLAADQRARMAAVGKLGDVFHRCLHSCGPVINAPLDQQLHLQLNCLAIIDAAIEMATKDAA